jgi:hypothetical protein
MNQATGGSVVHADIRLLRQPLLPTPSDDSATKCRVQFRINKLLDEPTNPIPDGRLDRIEPTSAEEFRRLRRTVVVMLVHGIISATARRRSCCGCSARDNCAVDGTKCSTLNRVSPEGAGLDRGDHGGSTISPAVHRTGRSSQLRLHRCQCADECRRHTTNLHQLDGHGPDAANGNFSPGNASVPFSVALLRTAWRANRASSSLTAAMALRARL